MDQNKIIFHSDNIDSSLARRKQNYFVRTNNDPLQRFLFRPREIVNTFEEYAPDMPSDKPSNTPTPPASDSMPVGAPAPIPPHRPQFRMQIRVSEYVAMKKRENRRPYYIIMVLGVLLIFAIGAIIFLFVVG